MDDLAQFGQALQHYRHVARLTQAELAERDGLSEREISDLERGLRKNPQHATVRLLTDALALTPQLADELELAAGLSPRPPLHATQPVDEKHNLPASLTNFVGRHEDR